MVSVHIPVPTGPWKRLGFAGFFMTTVLSAQQPATQATPTFDVVSIHVVPPDAPMIMRSQDFTSILPGGQYVDSRTLLLFMIAFAYDVKNPSSQLVGLPNWAKSQSYAVSAKPAENFPALSPAENQEQVRLMMRAMLAERFQLRLHTETRQERVFNLNIAKGGLKIRNVDPPVPPAKAGNVGAAMDNRGGRIIGNKSTMAGLAIALTVFLKKPVVDQTGSKDYYDFNAQWSTTDAPDEQGSEGLSTVGLGLLISAVQNQFGLHLTNTPGAVKYWVVDHIEPPTSN